MEAEQAPQAHLGGSRRDSGPDSGVDGDQPTLGRSFFLSEELESDWLWTERYAAVVGKPDQARTEIVKAFVVLASRVALSEALIRELQQHMRERLSAHAYPREIAFVADLLKTPSGKLQRFLLRRAALRPTTASSQAERPAPING